MPDLAGEAEMLEWANISFGEEDTYNDQDYWRILMITPVPNSTFGNIK